MLEWRLAAACCQYQVGCTLDQLRNKEGMPRKCNCLLHSRTACEQAIPIMQNVTHPVKSPGADVQWDHCWSQSPVVLSVPEGAYFCSSAAEVDLE
jgi:hypothetical protein